MSLVHTSIVLALLICSASPQSLDKEQQTLIQLHAGRNDVEFSYKGRVRTAVIFVPRSPKVPSGGWPLVVMLHGAGGSAKNVIESTGWVELGEREGFVTAFPDGTPKNERRRASFLLNPQTWNSGQKESLAAGESSATAKSIDDVGFLSELIDRISREVRINPKTIYVAGHSNGASMAYRFGAERATLVAAVGVVAGQFSVDAKPLISPVSLIQIIGDHDPFTPMEGGEVRIAGRRATVPPALQSPRIWATTIGLPNDSTVVRDDDKLKILEWGTSKSRVLVRSVIIKGHGHAYPSPNDRFHPRILLGPMVHTLDATETMWQFFRDRPKN